MNLFRFLFLLVFFILLNIYLFNRGWQAMPDNRVVHTVYTLLYIFTSTAIFFAIFAGNRLPVATGRIFELVGGYWMILFVFTLSGALLGDILRILNHYFGIFPDWVTRHYAQAKLIYFFAVLTVLAFISVMGYYRFSHPKITKMNLTVNHGKVLTHDMNIIAVSDIHLGNLIRKKQLGKWVNLINKQDPDVILIVGDLFDHNIHAVELQHMNDDLLKLKATYGVFGIPGNHDYYAGIDKAIQYMKSSGIKVLRDTSVVIDKQLILIGRDDLTNRNRKPLNAIINGSPDTLPKIVLDHQPSGFAESEENGIDVHISGHTHNGQLFPFNKVVSRIYKLGYGYLKSGNTHFYVSSGLGLWGAPIRLGTQSEIVNIVLKSSLNAN
ncbi:MAG TPA: metallophosphoesterase [Bacteroidales bacterium]|nr:metallophosphoesterase [Bacteroidales bacterium]